MNSNLNKNKSKSKLKRSIYFLSFIAILSFFLVVGISRLSDKISILRNDVVKSKDFSFSSDALPKVTEETSKPNLEGYQLSIPSLGIVAPINSVNCADYNAYISYLNQGLIHCIGTSAPGEYGNSFIAGHSSAEARSPYESIFATLPDFPDGSEIILSHNDKTYKYIGISEKIVEETDISVMDQSDDTRLTLMTCWPVGTADKRYIVTATLADSN